MKKSNFSGKFLLNAAYAIVFSYPIVLLSILLISLRSPISNFLFTTFVMFSILVFRFWREGYSDGAKEKVPLKEFALSSLPTWALLSICQTAAVFLFNTQILLRDLQNVTLLRKFKLMLSDVYTKYVSVFH